MAKKQNAISVISGLALVGIVGYYIYDKFFKNGSSPSANNNTAYTNYAPAAVTAQNYTSVPAEIVSPVYDVGYPIVYMKYHPDVKLLQQAVGVTADGIIGPATLVAIGKYIVQPPPSIVIASRANLNNMLSKINDAKARTGSTLPFLLNTSF